MLNADKELLQGAESPCAEILSSLRPARRSHFWTSREKNKTVNLAFLSFPLVPSTVLSGAPSSEQLRTPLVRMSKMVENTRDTERCKEFKAEVLTLSGWEKVLPMVSSPARKRKTFYSKYKCRKTLRFDNWLKKINFVAKILQTNCW